MRQDSIVRDLSARNECVLERGDALIQEWLIIIMFANMVITL